MRKSSRDFISLFFNPGETVCVSPNKYGFHSVSQDCLNGNIPLVSPNPEVKKSVMTEKDIVFMCLNPVNGFRRDSEVTAYRSFLIEVDDLPIQEQWNYIQDMGMPFSVCVFSGNKSLHFGIVLDKDLDSIDTYKFIATWILRIMDKADNQTGLPTRSIRFPENKRNDKGNKVQKLLKMGSRISKDDLYIWLNKFPDKKPVDLYTQYEAEVYGSEIKTSIPDWLAYELKNGLDVSKGGRNKKWYQIGREFSKSGMNMDEAIEFLSSYFHEESDFRQREWKETIRSAYKNNGGKLDKRGE